MEFPTCINCGLPLDMCVCQDDPGGTDDDGVKKAFDKAPFPCQNGAFPGRIHVPCKINQAKISRSARSIALCR